MLLLELMRKQWHEKRVSKEVTPTHLIKNKTLSESTAIMEMDSESLEQREMRQANERNRLIEQI